MILRFLTPTIFGVEYYRVFLDEVLKILWFLIPKIFGMEYCRVFLDENRNS